MADIYLKVHHGTGKLTGEHLCRSCVNGFRAQDGKGEYLRCSYFGFHKYEPQGKVTDCNAYMNKGLPTLHEMKETAWTLRTEKGGRVIGFVPPKDDFDKSGGPPSR